MKKAKIMLSAIAILAVVGGAFAFKAARVNHTFFSLDTNNGICSVPFATTYTTVLPTTTVTSFYSVSTTVVGPCRTLSVREVI
jgi:hypothetical protein